MYLLLLGIAPSIFVYRAAIDKRQIRQAVTSRIILSVTVLSLAVAVVFMFSSHYASFIREHKPLRYYTNPATFIYSTIKYAKGFTKNKIDVLQPIGQDAIIPADDEHRELIIFVVGESARYDRFSLNGYQKETNPLLKQEDVISYNNFWSCGTSTAVSVPCMFSIYSRSEYDSSKVQSTENVLDILQRSGVNVLWRDNNSSSKGVALRVPYESFRTADTNPLCDGECRDEGMLNGLQRYINNHKSGDIFIVLHQLGNHEPAYYKRYPESFERFTPVCKTNQLEECSKEEVNNTYDNIILYTDYFLSKVIAFLKENSANFETGMMYVSDHGESLGENRLFLHGLPYLFSPEEQRHVPAIMWFGESFDDMDITALQQKIGKRYSHDNLFHTILALLEIETNVYDSEMDILKN